MAHRWTIFVVTLLTPVSVFAQDASFVTTAMASCTTSGPVRTVARFPAGRSTPS